MSRTKATRLEERLYGDDSERTGDRRSPFERDRSRILHSAAFRRLQGKTQVVGVAEGDFHRTRLTHSIECAQIGNGLLQHLKFPKSIARWKPSRDLVEAACFAHDLGHPPFGHEGEVALHKCMINNGGFEGNGQTLRILTKLEKFNVENKGLNPTRGLLLAVLKYPVPMSLLSTGCKRPPKGYLDEDSPAVDFALEIFNANDCALFRTSRDGKSLFKSLHCSIMELADDIAYAVHDVEDTIGAKRAEKDEIREKLKSVFFDSRTEMREFPNLLITNEYSRKQTIGALVNTFITEANIAVVDGFQHPLLRYNVKLPPDLQELMKRLKGMTQSLVIDKARIQQQNFRGAHVVENLFTALSSHPSLVDEEIIPDSNRGVCDYIACMTDVQAERIFRRLFSPGFRNGSHS